MKFGKVEDPSIVDFTLPEDDPKNASVLKIDPYQELPTVRIGCASWNRQSLKNFYPRGTKNDLGYYSSQFNSIEFNASFYRIFPEEQIKKWRDQASDDFKFFPKVPQIISQFKRLTNVQNDLERFIHSIETFEDKLGTVFLQMHPNFTIKNNSQLEDFIRKWPNHIPLAIELRDPEWYYKAHIAPSLFTLYERQKITHIITDTAGHRELIQMRLTTPKVFVRFIGTNHPVDFARLDQWFERLKNWIDQGIHEIDFFIHQNHEARYPLLAEYFTKKLNTELGFNLTIPKTLEKPMLLF